jgi:DNA ligase-associated metallophosphoesterase
MLNLKPERLALQDFNSQPVSICGKSFVADQSGALYWGAEKALIIADLHLEKGSAHAARGIMLPPYDTRATLLRLAEAIDRYEVECVIALGDSVHDVGAADRIARDDLDILRIMQEDRRWIWVTGNHDPVVGDAFGGEIVDELCLEGLVLRHVPRVGRVTHEIAGHMHPAAKLSMYGSGLRRPCFVGNGLRLILPAFGAFAGGLNVLDEAFMPLFGDDGMSVWMLGQEGLYPIATRQLRGD